MHLSPRPRADRAPTWPHCGHFTPASSNGRAARELAAFFKASAALGAELYWPCYRKSPSGIIVCRSQLVDEANTEPREDEKWNHLKVIVRGTSRHARRASRGARSAQQAKTSSSPCVRIFHFIAERGPTISTKKATKEKYRNFAGQRPRNVLVRDPRVATNC